MFHSVWNSACLKSHLSLFTPKPASHLNSLFCWMVPPSHSDRNAEGVVTQAYQVYSLNNSCLFHLPPGQPGSPPFLWRNCPHPPTDLMVSSWSCAAQDFRYMAGKQALLNHIQARPLPPLNILSHSPIGLKVQCKVHRPGRPSVVSLLTPPPPWVLLRPPLSSAPDFTPSHLQHTLCASVTGHLELWSNLSSEMLFYHCPANVIH